MNYRDELVDILIDQANNFASSNYGPSFAHSRATSKSSVIFKDIELNFNRKSWRAIKGNPTYDNRIKKIHSHFADISPTVYEMQSSNSSDALAMNVFCHPKFVACVGIQKLFQTTAFSKIEFGHRAKVNKISEDHENADRTEVDVFINDSIIIECKLTEADFTEQEKAIVEEYSKFTEVFDTKYLVQTDSNYKNYQIIRNVLAANQYKYRFILICDMRRPDLAKSYFDTIKCIKDIELRSRCEIIYWQDITKLVDADLNIFLRNKYGI